MRDESWFPFFKTQITAFVTLAGLMNLPAEKCSVASLALPRTTDASTSGILCRMCTCSTQTERCSTFPTWALNRPRWNSPAQTCCFRAQHLHLTTVTIQLPDRFPLDDVFTLQLTPRCLIPGKSNTSNRNNLVLRFTCWNNFTTVVKPWLCFWQQQNSYLPVSQSLEETLHLTWCLQASQSGHG